MLYEDNYLAHYGIKGQRWGLRRFQNEDGSLTDEGMRRYGVTDEKGKLAPSNDLKRRYKDDRSSYSLYAQKIQKEKAQGKEPNKRRKELTERYIAKGMTREQAEIQALRRYNTEKLVKVAGAIALTAAVAYGAYKGHQWLQRYGDKTLRKGSDVFRVMSEKTPPEHAGFATNKVPDAVKYRGLWGGNLQQRNGEAYQLAAKTNGRIRLAGQRSASKVYKNLLKNDPEFAKANAEIMRENGNNPIMNLLTKWNQRNDYEKFNLTLAGAPTDADKIARSKFFGALKAKGYGGVRDINDMAFSGYNTKNPFILFNFKSNLGKTTIKQLTRGKIMESERVARELIQKESIRTAKVAKTMSAVGSTAWRTAVPAGAAGIGLFATNKQADVNAAQYRSVINQYRKEHPNSKLSDKEILENELGG